MNRKQNERRQQKSIRETIFCSSRAQTLTLLAGIWLLLPLQANIKKSCCCCCWWRFSFSFTAKLFWFDNSGKFIDCIICKTKICYVINGIQNGDIFLCVVVGKKPWPRNVRGLLLFSFSIKERERKNRKLYRSSINESRRYRKLIYFPRKKTRFRPLQTKKVA